MSKRFGRNQKRRMREEIAEASRREAGLRRDLKLTSELYTELRTRMESWARIIHHELGPEHPFNEDIIQVIERRLPELHERRRFAERPKVAPFAQIGSSMSYRDVSHHFLETVTHLVEVRPDAVNFSVRCMVTAPDKSSAYMIDEQALFKGRSDPRFVNWISREIARNLSAHLTRA